MYIIKYPAMYLAGSLMFLVLFGAPGFAQSDSIIFLSTQLTPVGEAAKMRSVILKGFPGKVDFQPNDNRHVFLELASGKGGSSLNPGVLGGLHGDLISLAKSGILDDLSDFRITRPNRKFVDKFAEMGKMGGKKLLYVPWMQATYIMAANRKALKYLPRSTKINNMTYDQLVDWGANIRQAVGEPKIGFPVGRNGLMHRFLQGYIFPSYTGGTVRNFRDSEEMWKMMRRLWAQTTPRSLTFGHMYEPLLTGEVWVAFDHTSRIIPALKKKPEDFVVFPAPAGPKGRGFMVVLAGLSVPVNAPDRAASLALINYLTRPEIQIQMLQNVGFFPVVSTKGLGGISPELEAVMKAVDNQASSPDALPVMLPTGLGEKGREFNAVYSAAFTRIVLRGKKIAPVLEKQAQRLRDILVETGVACWPSDAKSDGPCPVE